MWNSRGCKNWGTKSKWKYFPKADISWYVVCVQALYTKAVACYSWLFSCCIRPFKSLDKLQDCWVLSVVLQSCLCFSGRHVLLMRFGCISTLDVLHFSSPWKTCPFPNTPSPSGTHNGAIGVLIFGGAAEWAKESPKWWESHNSWGWKAPITIVQPKPWKQGHLSRLPNTMATWLFSIFNYEESATSLSSLFHCSTTGDLSGTTPATV